jgi:hypothetical protein
VQDEIPRSRAARVAAETALVRVVHHYGSRPEFVLMGGLLPEYLCAESGFRHAGTPDEARDAGVGSASEGEVG